MISELFIALGFLVLFVYWLLRRRQHFWRDRGMPGPPPRLFFLNLDEIDDPKDLPKQLREWTRQYGKIYGFHYDQQSVAISDLDLVQEVMVKRFDLFHGRFAPVAMEDVDSGSHIHVLLARGLRWKRLRSITNPVFTVSSFRRLLPTVQDSISHLIDRIDKYATDATPFDIYEWYQRLTMDIISRVAMGETESNLDTNEWYALFKIMFAKPESIYTKKWKLLTFCMPEMRYVVHPINRARDKLRSLWSSPVEPPGFMVKLRKLVENRRKVKDSFDGPLDFIQLFLNAEAEAGWDKQAGSMASQAHQLHMQSLKVAKKLTSAEIVNQLILFLIAGFDTTANTLSFTTGLLALHPQVQEKVIAEIDQQIPDEEELTYESIQKLKYLHHVTKEVLRLFPTGSFVTVRHSPVPTRLGDHEIPADTTIFVDAWSIHHNKEVWGEDADQFRPERFDKEEKATRHPLAWLPFGAGPRMCPGQRFALLEDKLTLVNLLRRYRFRRCSDTHLTATFQGPNVGTVSPEKVRVILERRTDKY